MPSILLPLLLADGAWSAMVHLGPSVLEKVLRPIFVYAFLVLLLRVFGKRELAQLNPFDLVVLLCLSNTVQNAIIGEDSSVTGGLIGSVALCAINYVVVRFLFRHRRLDQILEGEPAVLIEGGRLREAAMARELITAADLQSIAHRQGFAALDEVARCVLEPGGTFAIDAKGPRQEERSHRELLDRIDALSRQVADLSERLGPARVTSPDRP